MTPRMPAVRALIGALMILASTFTVAQTTILVGTGSTVPQPLFNSWADHYNKTNSAVQMKYLGLGTSEGIQQVTKGSGDFGAGELRMSPKDLQKDGLVMVPVAVVGIVPIYNVPGVKELRFSGEVLAEIFQGKIKNWNDAKLGKLNPGAKLPDLAIKVVHRPDGKGSNYIFTNFLSKSNADFRAAIGVSASPKWPVGAKAERSSDVVEMVKSTAGAIGYVEHSYAVKNSVEYGTVENASGQFVKASKASLTAAAGTASAASADDADITGSTAKEAYPLASFTWMYVRAKSSDAKRGGVLNSFMTWIVGDGQTYAEQEGYVALPSAVAAHARKTISSLK